MELASELRRALDGVCGNGAAEVRENGQRLTSLDGLSYEVRGTGESTLLHLWSPHQNVVRRVVRVAEQSPERVVLEIERFGHSKHARLELNASVPSRDPYRSGREQFSDRLRRLLTDHFPDETVESLSTAADLHRSLSGCYTRGVMHRGSEARAVMAASPEELAATIDGILTFALLWLDHLRDRAKGHSVHGLRLFLRRDTSQVTAHRITGLASPREIELYEYDPVYWRMRKVAISDAGNVATWIVPRREMDQTLAILQPEAARIRALAPDAIRVSVSAATREVSFRFRGIEFARVRQGALRFGVNKSPSRQNEEDGELLTPITWPKLEVLVGQLQTYRHPLATDTKHRFYRAQPERWLETMVAADPGRIDARLDPGHIYSQVPASSSGEHGIIDLLGVTRDGRLAVLELKAGEDIQLVMQAVDYWLRVRWHQEQDDFRRYGYFAGVPLQAKPPLLFLVAPGLRFHPSTDTVLRYLSPEIRVERVGLGENWRRSLRVVYRQ